MRRTPTRLALLLSTLLAPAPRLAAQPPATLHLAGHVTGWSGKYPLHVALWQSEGFLEHPAKEIVIPPGAAPAFQFEVPPGRWALSAFEDRNSNGVLDMGLFTPREPAGFWRPFHGWHKPRFDEVASPIDRDTTTAEITLH